LYLLNNDVVLDPGALDALARCRDKVASQEQRFGTERRITGT
jgi:hypothetical protein